MAPAGSIARIMLTGGSLRMMSLLGGLIVSLALGLEAQSAPAFEIATIKPSGPDSPPMSLQRQPGGRLVTSNTPLTFLLGWAFNLDERRLYAMPPGAASARFDLDFALMCGVRSWT